MEVESAIEYVDIHLEADDMKRRAFVGAGLSGALIAPVTSAAKSERERGTQDGVRAMFPRVVRETFVNAAGGTPLGIFAEAGLRRYADFQRLGPGDGRGDYVAEVTSNVRRLCGELIGARESEIALVHCTKAGEQIVLDGLEPWRRGGNVVTNDMHFSGSLHNLVGLRMAGADVRVVRATDWDVSLERMEAAIDHRTSLVAISLVSNVNGRIEPVRELAEIAHAHGALVYADIMQAAGIVPLNVHDLGIDFASCNGYKWLYGVHGAGFMFVREALQGTGLPDRLFPGHVRYNYPPWVERADPSREDLEYESPRDARRYQPGHVSYIGYCALYEGLKFLARVGVSAALQHSVRLNQRLMDQLNPEHYECISPHRDKSPIITFLTRDAGHLETRLRHANATVSLGSRRVRVSAAIYNQDDDIDRLAEAMNV